MPKKIVLGLALVLVAVQFWPVDRSNPPVTGEITAPPHVMEILRTSCYDCHSHETAWPWYSRVAPVSIWVADHVEEGRAELNFSEWGAYTARRADHKLDELVEKVEEHAMPLPSYLWAHGDADLSQEQRDVLVAWAEGVREELGPAVEAENLAREQAEASPGT